MIENQCIRLWHGYVDGPAMIEIDALRVRFDADGASVAVTTLHVEGKGYAEVFVSHSSETQSYRYYSVGNGVSVGMRYNFYRPDGSLVEPDGMRTDVLPADGRYDLTYPYRDLSAMFPRLPPLDFDLDDIELAEMIMEDLIK